MVAGVFVLLSACQSSPSIPPSIAVIPQQTDPQKGNLQIVYLDISESMRGFARRGSQYEKALWELRNLLDKQYTSVYLVDSMLQPEARGLEVIAEAGWNGDLYRGEQNNLAATFTHLKTADASKLPLMLLITDGVQSLYKQSSNEGCDQGSDWICVKQEMQKLLNQGWFGCVFGIRSEFDGQIFPEKDSRRIRFPYQSNPQNLLSFRPVYFFLFTPSRELFTQFATQLRKKLDVNLYEGSCEIAELTSLTPVLPAIIKSKQYTQNHGLRVVEEQSTKHPPLQDFSRAFIYANVKALEPYNLILNIAVDTRYENSQVSWKLEQVYFSSISPGQDPAKPDDKLRYPEIGLIQHQMSSNEVEVKNIDGIYSLPIKIDWPETPGIPAWRVYRLDAFSRETDAPSWIQDWSTGDDTIPNQANRTLFLDKMVGELWTASSSKGRKIMELYLWVGPEDE